MRRQNKGSVVPSAYTGSDLTRRYTTVRHATEDLCQPLEVEDYQIQTMPDVSPTKWHIAHVTWFFETFLLQPYLANYQVFDPNFAYLFNSYYETVGTFHPRPQRGLLNRPILKEVLSYRAYVDEHMHILLQQSGHPEWDTINQRILTGINHEQQHQELMLTDIKHVFASNPLRPAYASPVLQHAQTRQAHLNWISHPGGLQEIGNKGDGDFCFDNELPAHSVYLEPFKVASRLVTNGEYIDFINDRGYSQSEFWLSDGWATVKSQQWHAPLYWEQRDGEWWQMTLHGMKAIEVNSPVSHVSLYEADAYARWAGKRLLTEAEWEVIAAEQKIVGNLRDSGYLEPMPATADIGIQQLYGDVWEWTASSYAAYPRFRPLAGSLGEYNGKFMCNQLVLRGGSCVTPADHIRRTYRNFFYPKDRWQFSGFRLAQDD